VRIRLGTGIQVRGGLITYFVLERKLLGSSSDGEKNP
jgi:hypothetical protein